MITPCKRQMFTYVFLRTHSWGKSFLSLSFPLRLLVVVEQLLPPSSVSPPRSGMLVQSSQMINCQQIAVCESPQTPDPLLLPVKLGPRFWISSELHGENSRLEVPICEVIRVSVVLKESLSRGELRVPWLLWLSGWGWALGGAQEKATGGSVPDTRLCLS